MTKPASCLFIIFILPANKVCFIFEGGFFSTIIHFFVGTHLVCACRGAVIGSPQHTRLLAASADARLVLKYFSSTKVNARDAAVGTATY